MKGGAKEVEEKGSVKVVVERPAAVAAETRGRE